nr:MAG: capsid protein [Wenzhou shrew picornavirus 1]
MFHFCGTMMSRQKSKSVSATSGINVTGTIANLLEPIPVVGAIAGALKGLASSWLSTTTNGLLNESGFEIGHKTSDRLLAISAGVGAISTQEAVSVRDGWAGAEPKPVPVPATDKPTLPGPAAERLEFISEGEWTEADTLYSDLFCKAPLTNGLFFPHAFYQDSPANPVTTFMPNAQRHMLSKMDFTVVVTVNANTFTAGVLLVVAVPNFPYRGPFVVETDLTPLPVSQLTLFPHQFINLKTNNQATLILPYHGPSPLFDHTTTPLYRLLGIVYSPLVTTNAQSGTTINWIVQAAPMDVAFHGVRNPMIVMSANLEGLPVRVTPNVAAVVTTSPLDDVVVLAEGSQTRLETDYLPGRVTSLSQPLSVPTRMMPYTDTPGFTVNASNNRPGTLLYSFPVDLGNIMFSGTYLGEWATCYTHWTGELIFSLMCASNTMTRGRIVVCFSPGLTGPPYSMQLAMLSTFQVYDIGLNSTFVFPIPFISRTHWRRTIAFDMGGTNRPGLDNRTSYQTFDPAARAGVVSVWLYNSLQVPAPGAATNVHFIPFISASSDFSFRLPQAPTPYVAEPDDTPVVPFGKEEDECMHVRFEAPEPVVMMGANDGAAAEAAPTQASAESTPVVYTNLEDGQPSETMSKDVWEGMAGLTFHSSPDMLLENFFGRLRLYKTLWLPQATVDYPANKDPRSGFSQRLLPLKWGSLFAEKTNNLLELFSDAYMYANCDVRVDLVFFPANGAVDGQDPNNPGNKPVQRYPRDPFPASTVRVTNLPPGYKELVGVKVENYTNMLSWSQLSMFPTVVSSLNSYATTVSVYIPFQSLYNALPSVYSGYRSLSALASIHFPVSRPGNGIVNPRVWGDLADSEFATLCVTLEAPLDFRCEVYVSYHNLQAFIPRPFVTRPITNGVSPNAAWTRSKNNGWEPNPAEDTRAVPESTVNETDEDVTPEAADTSTADPPRERFGRVLNKLTNLSVR